MLIILMAISLIFIIQMIYALIGSFSFDLGSETETDYHTIEEKWHEEASGMENISREQIHQHFKSWKQDYPNASMFWVDENGLLTEQLDVKEDLPKEWTSAFTAKFMKERYGGDPFTVIAFVGKDEMNGFIVLEMPRSTFAPPIQKLHERYGIILFVGMVLIIFLFIAVSFLFFRGIRKRLLQLQEAMAIRDVDSLPIPIEVKRQDEVGQLEQTFNQMVNELKKSKQREQEEEQLRRELIANLSHDLRTPLTKINAQTDSLKQEDLTEEAKQAIKTLENSIRDIDRLIENLMSYTLLMASKYHFNPEEIDVIRLVRECLASWYSVFEQEGFEIDIELHPFENEKWTVDPIWLNRILDNLFQNVVRHAKSGKYIKVKTESTARYDAFVIIDRGKGMKHRSNEKGVGVGLSIVDMMVKGMKLDWDIESSEHGTAIKIKNYKSRVFERE